MIDKLLKYTKGPWRHTKGHIGAKIADFVSCNPKTMDGMHIHNGEKSWAESSEESEANARLIEGAPEMMDFIITIMTGPPETLNELQVWDWDLDQQKKGEEIIKKYTGSSFEEIKDEWSKK